MYQIQSFDVYNFTNAQTDAKSLIHAINFLGDDLIGAEIGVFKAENFCSLLQNCPNIKTLYGVDSYQPYQDYLREGPSSNTPAYGVSKRDIDFIKLVSFHNQKYSGNQDKIIFLEMDSNEAADKIENDSLDFIFIDTYLTYEQAVNDINVWYPKVKSGGLFAGHDWNSFDVQKAVHEFRIDNNINNCLSLFDNVWGWKK